MCVFFFFFQTQLLLARSRRLFFFSFPISFSLSLSHLRRVLHEPALVNVPEELVGLGVLDALGDGLFERGTEREKKGGKRR